MRWAIPCAARSARRSKWMSLTRAIHTPPGSDLGEHAGDVRVDRVAFGIEVEAIQPLGQLSVQPRAFEPELLGRAVQLR
jgi:hypothetical protein